MIVLKPAIAEDYDRIARLHAENWRMYYRGILSHQFLDKSLDAYMTNTWQVKLEFPPPGQHTTLAIEDGQLHGFACLVLDDDEKYGSMLDNLHVAIHAQNKGIGKLLMESCAKQILASANSRKMYLWVYEQNKNAIKVYEKLGGIHAETVIKETAEGSPAVVYRFTWPDVDVLMLAK